jgi:type IV pilus assembly protein PilB
MTEPAQTPSVNPVVVPPAATPPVVPPVAPPQPIVVTQPNTLIGVLVKNAALSQSDADMLAIEQMSSGIPIEQLIQDKKMVTEEALAEAKAEFYEIPFISVTEVGIAPEALGRLPESVARRYKMLPFAVSDEDNTLSVAMIDPLDVTAIDFAQQKTGLRVIAHYGVPSEIEQKIAERYAQSLSGEVTRALEETTQIAEQHKKEEDFSAISGGIVRQAPITKIVETIVTFAINSRASDVHIEPQADRTRIRYRIDGILQEKLILPKSVHEAVVSRIKILSRLKIDEKRIPQDGRFNFQTEGKEVDLRISTLPTINGEKIVMRLLNKDMKVPTMAELGINGLGLRQVEDAIKVPHGIVLITGPTGSGKTTTLYSILNQINSPKVNIVTLEDPVEYQMLGVNQVQINPQAGLTFASGLRSFLRQDPNIIMVGEIRDSETVTLAIQASLTGHLVFSTLHTSSAAGAVPRLVDMGAEAFLLASSLQLIMAQRVVRQINPEYKETYTPDPAVVEDIKKVLGPQFDVWCKTKNVDPTKVQLYRPMAKRPQNEPEYKGRIGIFEIMPITEEMAQLVVHQATDDQLQELAVKNGMLLMKQDGYLKALDGITTIEEVLRVAEV